MGKARARARSSNHARADGLHEDDILVAVTRHDRRTRTAALIALLFGALIAMRQSLSDRPPAEALAMVALAVDDREVFRRQIDATTMDGTTIDGKVIDGKVIDLDISGGRRLVVTVDFCGPGGTNAAIRFTDPVIEK